MCAIVNLCDAAVLIFSIGSAQATAIKKRISCGVSFRYAATVIGSILCCRPVTAIGHGYPRDGKCIITFVFNWPFSVNLRNCDAATNTFARDEHDLKNVRDIPYYWR